MPLKINITSRDVLIWRLQNVAAFAAGSYNTHLLDDAIIGTGKLQNGRKRKRNNSFKDRLYAAELLI